MHRGTAKQYAMIPETWALEYARGESNLENEPALHSLLGSNADLQDGSH
jgi:hypothetical protein